MGIALVIDPDDSELDLSNTAGGWRVTGFDPGNPALESQWASSADTEGELRASTRPTNREVTATVLIQNSTDALLAAQERLLGAKVGKLARDGGVLELTYPDARVILFDVIEAEHRRTFTPTNQTAGIAEYQLTFRCKPYGRGEQVTGDVESGTTPALDFVVSDIPGDVEPLIDLVATEAESEDRRYVQWGAGPDTTSPVIIDSDDLVTSGFGGTGGTRTGAYDPNSTGNNVISTTLFSSVASICGTGEQDHAGGYHVFARVYSEVADAQVRLVWQDKDGPYTPNPWFTVSAANQWTDADLGIISSGTTDVGAQGWQGRLEGVSATNGDFDVDFLLLVPIDFGYGVARAVNPDVAGVVAAIDAFTGTTSGSNLNGRTPGVGAAWATSGATTDFQFIDVGAATSNPSEAVSRSASSASFRYAVLGSSMADQQVQAAHGVEITGVGGTGECGLILRWTDANNYLRFTLTTTVDSSATITFTAKLTKVVAGAATLLATESTSDTTGGQFGAYPILRCTARASGSVQADVLTSAGAAVMTLAATDSVLATGGTLDDGKPGIIDSGDGSTTLERWYDNVVVYTPAPEDIALYADQDIQIRPGRVERASSDGTRYGRPSSVVGFTIRPNPGDIRIAVRAHRTDLQAAAYDTVDDELDAQVFYTPRYLVVPDA